ncbi:MAG: hypothetical protein MUE82_01105 [Chloroflexi bacterium]|jgi:hypothetical protein|nr:hypothetical protein [Chloroflexota bacterium]
MRRPRGIAIVALLLGLLGTLAVVFGALALAAYALGGTDPGIDAESASGVAVIGATYLVIGVAQVFVAWALWSLKRWAWWLTIILQGISVLQAVAAMAFTEVTSVDTAAFTSLAFSLVVLGYFLTKGVRTAFGR